MSMSNKHGTFLGASTLRRASFVMAATGIASNAGISNGAAAAAAAGAAGAGGAAVAVAGGLGVAVGVAEEPLQENLNARALEVINRIQAKLTGRDFTNNDYDADFTVGEQVKKCFVLCSLFFV